MIKEVIYSTKKVTPLTRFFNWIKSSFTNQKETKKCYPTDFILHKFKRLFIAYFFGFTNTYDVNFPKKYIPKYKLGITDMHCMYYNSRYNIDIVLYRPDLLAGKVLEDFKKFIDEEFGQNKIEIRIYENVTWDFIDENGSFLEKFKYHFKHFFDNQLDKSKRLRINYFGITNITDDGSGNRIKITLEYPGRLIGSRGELIEMVKNCIADKMNIPNLIIDLYEANLDLDPYST